MDKKPEDFNHTKFVNVGAAKKFTLISKNRSFLKKKGFHHSDNFFQQTIANKGWRAFYQPPRPATTMVVRELYANLASHAVQKVRVQGVLVDFSVRSIYEFYQLEPMDDYPYNRLQEDPNYPKVL